MSEVFQADLRRIDQYLRELNSDTLLFVVDNNCSGFFKTIKLPEDKRIYIFDRTQGEEIKSFVLFEEICEFFLEKGIHRGCHLIAIGGGATSDCAGLVAHSLLRGIEWSVIPTTLLAMIDASIGGKLGINSKFGKNLIGAFQLPKAVLINSDTLTTLPAEEYNSGRGELLKYALLDKGINQAVNSNLSEGELITLCGQYKQDLVDQDFKEKGVRAYLNLGHTFGHCFEKTHKLSHGIAVALGIFFIDEFFSGAKHHSEIVSLTEKLKIKLPGELKINSTQIKELVQKDKKRIDENRVNLIRLNEVGKPLIEAWEFNKINQILDSLEGVTWQPLK